MSRRVGLMTAAALILIGTPAFAGPPLLCFPFDIGSTQSLPIGTGDWHAVDPRYDASRVVDDTLALLTPATPVIARMETLRRATLYVGKDPARALELLRRLEARAKVSDANAPMAVFDFGYLAETYKQAAFVFGGPNRATKAADAIEGYSLVQKSAAWASDPQIEFALAVMTRGNTRVAAAHSAHLARVVKAAETDATIQANIARQFGAELAQR